MGYSSVVERRAICKMINYKNSAFDKLDGRIEYLLNPKKTNPKWQKGNFVCPGNAMHEFKVIYDRHNPKGTRFFRQGILSFGIKDLSVDTAFEVGCEVFNKGYENYPYFVCVHTDLPKHIHVHFLHFTVNVTDGTKWGQSPSEFQEFRTHVDSVLDKFRLPLLKRRKETDEQYVVDGVVKEVSEDEMMYPVQWTNINSPLPYQRIYYPSHNLMPSNSVSQTRCRLDLPRLKNDIENGLNEIKKIIYGGKFDVLQR